jgi:transcriptional regulator with XRE-family HTH domain
LGIYANPVSLPNGPMTGLHTEAHARLADRLREARERARVSQYELADRLGVDQSYVSKYETGRRRIDAIELLRITTAIGCDYREILDAVLQAGPL